MKLLIALFSFYIFSLNLLPCGDLDQYGIGHEYEITGHADDVEDHNHDHRGESDTCSPFCICACCGVITGFEIVVFELPTRSINQKEFSSVYQDNLYSNDLLFIWKPPKIS